MAFKTLIKRQGVILKAKTISITKSGKVYFSRDLVKRLEKFNYVEILVDEDYNKLAFKPTNDEDRGYSLLSFKKKSRRVIQCNCLVNMGISGRFKVRYTEGKIIVDDINVSKFQDMAFYEDEIEEEGEKK